MLRERGFDARYEVARVRLIVGMLELAPTAFGKVTARRLLVVRSGSERTIIKERITGDPERHVPPARRDAVAPRRDADD